MKLIDFSWNTITTIARRDHSSLRLVLDNRLKSPVLSGDSKELLVKVPFPRHVRGGFYTLHGLYFDHDEQSWDSAWRLFKASLYHAGLHGAYSDFKVYSRWAREKSLDVATYAVSLIEDLRITLLAARNWPGILSDIAYANYISSLRIREANEIGHESLRFATKLLLAVWGLNHAQRDDSKEDIDARVLAGKVRSSVRDGIKTKGEIAGRQLLGVLDNVYTAINALGRLTEIPSLPYTEMHGDCGVFDSRLVEDQNGRSLIESAYASLGLTNEDWSEGRESGEGSDFYQEITSAEEKLGAIRKNYATVLTNTALDSIEFPKSDYATYLRVRSSLSREISNVRARLSSIKNEVEEVGRPGCGQAGTYGMGIKPQLQLAPLDNRNDTLRGYQPEAKSEAWAILVDASKSVLPSAREVREVATFLAEVIKDLIAPKDRWALLSFSSSLQIIKDFSEDYSFESKARIGGLVQRGFTLLPDAMLACQRMLEYREVYTRVLVVVSGGFSIRHPDVETNLLSAAKRIANSGVVLMGIGINNNALKRYFRFSSVPENSYQMMKFFVKSYFELSSPS